MNADNERKLNAFKMMCCRRLLKIPWTDFVSNARVLARVGEENNVLVEDIEHHKPKYIAHKIWENGVFKLALQGRIQREIYRRK